MKKVMMAVAALLALMGSAMAQVQVQVNPSAIILQLGGGAAVTPAPGGGAVVLSPSDQSFVQQLREGRPVTAAQRAQLGVVLNTYDLPDVDLTVYFAFDSSEITPEALPVLIALGQALSSPELAGKFFVVSGHTDASGSNAYNQTLSEARAASVKAFLMQNYGIDSSRLIAVGFGEEQLKNWQNPLADENRRVNVVSIEG